MSALLKSESYVVDAVHASDNTVFSEAEYLAIQKNSDDLLEFIDGKIYAMTNISRPHGLISANIDRFFWLHLQNNPCKVYRETLKIKRDKNYFVPDIIVDCDQDNDSDYSENPILIIEVLSSSTRSNDLGVKFQHYQKIETLQEYVVIEQDSMCVDVYRKANNWEASRYLEGSKVHFQSIDFIIPIEDIYNGVKFRNKVREIHGFIIR